MSWQNTQSSEHLESDSEGSSEESFLKKNGIKSNSDIFDDKTEEVPLN